MIQRWKIRLVSPIPTSAHFFEVNQGDWNSKPACYAIYSPRSWGRWLTLPALWVSATFSGAFAVKLQECIPSLKLTVRTWKWMVGILVSFWDGLFSGANCYSECKCAPSRNQCYEFRFLVGPRGVFFGNVWKGNPVCHSLKVCRTYVHLYIFKSFSLTIIFQSGWHHHLDKVFGRIRDVWRLFSK